MRYKLGIKDFSLILAFAVLMAWGFVAFNAEKPDSPAANLPETEYQVTDKQIIERFYQAQSQRLDWSALLPEEDREAIDKYRFPAEQQLDLSEQIFQTMQASNDEAYQQAMYSMKSISEYNNQAISIPGFVVPIEFHQDQSPSMVFIVPYFGACIHFPPPPPNQIIFAHLEPGFNQFDIEQAYLFSGFLNEGLFEDQLGTSAYTLDLVHIEKYQPAADEYLQH